MCAIWWSLWDFRSQIIGCLWRSPVIHPLYWVLNQKGYSRVRITGLEYTTCCVVCCSRSAQAARHRWLSGSPTGRAKSRDTAHCKLPMPYSTITTWPRLKGAFLFFLFLQPNFASQWSASISASVPYPRLSASWLEPEQGNMDRQDVNGSSEMMEWPFLCF